MMLKSNVKKYSGLELELMNLKAIAVPQEQLDKLKAEEKQIVEETSPILDEAVTPVVTEAASPQEMQVESLPVVEENSANLFDAPAEEQTVVPVDNTNIFDAPAEDIKQEEISEEAPVVQEEVVKEETPRIEQVVEPTNDPVKQIQDAFEQLGQGINALIEENRKNKSELLNYLNELSKTTNDFNEELQRKKVA